jgi:hypothetical protein
MYVSPRGEQECGVVVGARPNARRAQEPFEVVAAETCQSTKQMAKEWL